MTDRTLPNKADPEPSRSIGDWVSIIVAHFMFWVAGLMGLLVLYAGLRLLVTGEQHWGVALLVMVMGMIFSALGIGFFYFQFFKLPVLRTRRRVLEARYPGQPWMLRSDWAARRVTDSSAGVMIFLWIWVVGWWGAILFIWSVNRDKILAAAAASWWEAALGLIFPLAGLIGLMFAWQATRSWLRYGRSVLRIDTLPGYLGETFRGALQANFRHRPAALEAELACEHVMWVTRRRNGKSTRERVTCSVWSKTHRLDTSRMMLAHGTAAASLPITLPLPADQPSCGLDDNDEGIVWRLTVREVTDDIGRRPGVGEDAHDHKEPLYSATFEVPVFAR